MAFIPYYKHLMDILNTNDEIKKAANRGNVIQMVWAAGGAVIGAVCLWPLGAIVGGLAGLFVGCLFSSDYDSLVAVIRDLNNDQKEQIVLKVQAEVGKASHEALIDFIGTQANREALLDLLQKFASSVKARG